MGFMEVFIFFNSEDELALVESTLDAWDKQEWADPVNVVQLPRHKFELKKRITADNMATEQHYIIADVGYIFEDARAIPQIVKRLRNTIGLVDLGGIKVCRKGVVSKWPTPRTTNYNKEHSQAVVASNYDVEQWEDISCKPIQAC